MTSAINSFADYLNGLAQHLASTVDGVKDDKRFDGLRSGKITLFDSNDAHVKEIYKSTKDLQKLPTE